MFKALTALSRFFFASKQFKNLDSLPQLSRKAVTTSEENCLRNLGEQSSGHATWRVLPCGRIMYMWVLKYGDSIEYSIQISSYHNCPSPLLQTIPLSNLMKEMEEKKISGIPIFYNHKTVYNFLIGLLKARNPEISAHMQYIQNVSQRLDLFMHLSQKKIIDQWKLGQPACEFRKSEKTVKKQQKNNNGTVQKGKNFSRKDYCEL